MKPTQSMQSHLGRLFADLEDQVSTWPALRDIVHFAGCDTRLHFSSPELRAAIHPSLVLRGAIGDPTLLQVYVTQTSQLEIRAQATVARVHALMRQHQVEYMVGPRWQVMDDGGGCLRVYDALDRRYLLAFTGHGPALTHARAAPFRHLAAWVGRDCGRHFLHAAGLCLDDQPGTPGLLLVGASGAGKSTTCAHAVRGGLFILGDDYVSVQCTGTGYMAGALYQHAKLAPDFARDDLDCEGDWYCPRDDGGHKAAVAFENIRSGSLSHHATIHAVVRVTVDAGATSRLEASDGIECFRELGVTSALQQAGYQEQVFRFCGALVRNLPCYQLKVGRDADGVAQLLKPLLLAQQRHADQIQGHGADGLPHARTGS